MGGSEEPFRLRTDVTRVSEGPILLSQTTTVQCRFNLSANPYSSRYVANWEDAGPMSPTEYQKAAFNGVLSNSSPDNNSLQMALSLELRRHMNFYE